MGEDAIGTAGGGWFVDGGGGGLEQHRCVRIDPNSLHHFGVTDLSRILADHQYWNLYHLGSVPPLS